MKILILCASDRSNVKVALTILKYICKTKDNISVCVIDNDKNILEFLKKKKIKIKKNYKDFLKNKVRTNDFDWLLNIWSPLILKKEFLKKFRNNLNLHPSYLPFSKGKDPYVWTVQNEVPVGVTIHEMTEKLDSGRFYLRKKYSLNFPLTGGDVFNFTLRKCVDEFIKNWNKIKTKKVKLKEYPIKINKVFKRLDLINDNFIDLDQKKNFFIKNLLLKILSQDFDFLKMQIKYKKKIFDAKLLLDESKKKIWL